MSVLASAFGALLAEKYLKKYGTVNAALAKGTLFDGSVDVDVNSPIL